MPFDVSARRRLDSAEVPCIEAIDRSRRMAIIRFIFGQDFVDGVCCTRSIRCYYDHWTDAHTLYQGAAFFLSWSWTGYLEEGRRIILHIVLFLCMSETQICFTRHHHNLPYFIQNSSKVRVEARHKQQTNLMGQTRSSSLSFSLGRGKK